jgi:hypothetical protein
LLFFAAVLIAVQLLPARLVSPGIRNVMPWLALLLGAVIWGVYAAAFAAIMDRDDEFQLQGWHHVSMVWHYIILLMLTFSQQHPSPLDVHQVANHTSWLSTSCSQGLSQGSFKLVVRRSTTTCSHAHPRQERL